MAKQAGESLENQVTIVAVGSVFEGAVKAAGDFRISGEFKGKLDVAGNAVVAEQGIVTGEIEAGNALIAGTVDGDLIVAEQLHLKGSARVTGTIRTGRLIVEEGAMLNGECQMGQRGQINTRGAATENASPLRAAGA